ncbi:MAG TPA: hypothetical protein VGS19_36190 [Streptosporangiaceae bacterium]|nr:hypothetical protein [Streptosporangiaceae bacterium]
MSGGKPQGVLRWYPPRWRARYGDELVTLLTDTYGERPVPLRCRLSLVRAGAVEWLREFGLAGMSAPPAEGIRAGGLVVLWAWAVFVVAGAGFAKQTEHWQSALPPHGWLPATVGFDTIFIGAAAGAAIVAAGAALCARALFRAVRAPGGWQALRGPVLWSVGFTVLAGALFAVTVAWAHHFGNGYVEAPPPDLPYMQGSPHMTVLAWLVLAWALAVSVMVASWTATATAAVRRIEPTSLLVRGGAALALALTAVMAAITAGLVLWWATLAVRAPWFFNGAAPGSPGALAPLPLLVVGVLMAAGLVMAAVGAWRVSVCLRRAGTADPSGAPAGH